MKRKHMIGKPIQSSKKVPDEKICYACNGSGRYDSFRSPKCGACEGKGYINNNITQSEEP